VIFGEDCHRWRSSSASDYRVMSERSRGTFRQWIDGRWSGRQFGLDGGCQGGERGVRRNDLGAACGLLARAILEAKTPIFRAHDIEMWDLFATIGATFG
jgi:hypothetical protein